MLRSVLLVALGLATFPVLADEPYLVRDINPGTTVSLISNFYATESLVFFRAHRDGSGSEPWRSDGTDSGTSMVADIDPTGNAYPANLTVIGDRLLFTAHDPNIGYELLGFTLPTFSDGFESGDTSKWSNTVP